MTTTEEEKNYLSDCSPEEKKQIFEYVEKAIRKKSHRLAVMKRMAENTPDEFLKHIDRVLERTLSEELDVYKRELVAIHGTDKEKEINELSFEEYLTIKLRALEYFSTTMPKHEITALIKKRIIHTPCIPECLCSPKDLANKRENTTITSEQQHIIRFIQSEKWESFVELAAEYDIDSIRPYTKKYMRAEENPWWETLADKKKFKGILEMAKEDMENAVNHSTTKATVHRQMDDKITHEFFGNGKRTEVASGKMAMKILENPRDRKRKEKIYSMLGYCNAEGLAPLYDAFTREVFYTCYSIVKAGNAVTTTDIIYQHMAGKVGRRVMASQKMKNAILEAVRSLAQCWIRVLCGDAEDAFHYKGRRTYEGILMSAAIECNIVDGNIVEDAIALNPTKFSVLMDIAEVRNQVLSYSAELLDTPVNKDKETIVLQCELLRLIKHIVDNRNKVGPYIKIETVMENTDYRDMDRTQKKRMRDKVIKMLNYWKQEGLFQNYEIERKGNIPVRIRIEK